MLVWLFSDNQCGLLRGRREGCYATLSLSQFEALERGGGHEHVAIGGSKPHLKRAESGVVLCGAREHQLRMRNFILFLSRHQYRTQNSNCFS